MCHGFIIDSAQGQNQCTEDAGSVFACRAMQEQRTGGSLSDVTQNLCVRCWSMLKNVRVSRCESLGEFSSYSGSPAKPGM